MDATTKTRVAAFERCLARSMGVLVDHAKAGIHDERDGVVIAAVGAGGTEFNLAFVLASPREPRRTLDWLTARLGDLSTPWAVQVDDARAAELADHLTAAGFACEERLPLMVRDLRSMDTTRPPGLRVEVVRDADGLGESTLAAAIGFGAPAEALLPVFPPSLVEDPRVTFLNGHLDGAARPQATAVAVVVDDLVGVFGITTHEEVRRRGVGAAMTWEAMEVGARAGARTAVLQASPMGEPVYRRMGFRTVLHHQRWTREDAHA